MTTAALDRPASNRKRPEPPRSGRRFVYENGLSLAMFAIFFATLIGQIFAGWNTYNDELSDHRQPELSLVQYLRSGHFYEGLSENWESEFLQMAAFVWLTGILVQKGSPESKAPGEPDEDPPPTERSPWAARQGGWVRKVYENSLALAFLALWLISMAIHGASGAALYNADQIVHHQPTLSIPRFMVSSRFCFQSFQNAQSEFLSIGLMIVLSIFLRQKGSPESKAVTTPHSEND